MSARLKLIYLDQNKWIDFSRAENDRTDGKRFKATFNAAEEAVDKGAALFPLGHGHYVETLNTNDIVRRGRLAKTMAKLSQFRTLIDQDVMRDFELRRALRDRFGEYVEVPSIDILGFGASHVFPPSEGPSSDELRQLMGPEMWYEYELNNLSGAPPVWEEDNRQSAKQRWTAAAERVVTEDLAVDSRFEELKLLSSKRHQVLDLAEAQGILKSALPILAAANLPGEVLHAQPDDWPCHALKDLPLLYCIHQLLLRLYDNPSLAREGNNLVDVTSIAQGIVCCDVVVTEKQWVDLARQAKLDERFRVTMLANVNDLADLLEAP